MKYKIKNSDIFIDGKIISEGSEVELSPVQIQGIEYLLIPIESKTEYQSESSEETQKKIKTKGNKK